MTSAEEVLKIAAEQRLYLVFAGDDYYPAGGAADYIGRVTCSTDAQAIELGAAMAKGHAPPHRRSGWWMLARLTAEGHLDVVEEGSCESGGHRELPAGSPKSVSSNL